MGLWLELSIDHRYRLCLSWCEILMQKTKQNKNKQTNRKTKQKNKKQKTPTAMPAVKGIFSDSINIILFSDSINIILFSDSINIILFSDSINIILFSYSINIILWHKSDYTNKQTKKASKISVEPKFTSYEWFCCVSLLHRLLCCIKSFWQELMWKLLSFHTEMISA